VRPLQAGAARIRVESSGSGPPALLVHGSFALPEDVFAAQLPLADAFRLLLVTRRGFSLETLPDGRADFEVDAADIASLLEQPAHLVGHSYGCLGCLLAAARKPERVLSLTVIEPPAFLLALDDPRVAKLVERLQRAFTERGDGPELYGRVLEAFGFRPPRRRPSARMQQAIRASATERSPWKAAIPATQLAEAPFPKLVVSGGWVTMPAEPGAWGGAVFNRVCDVLAERIGTERLVFEEAGHLPQQLGEPFNARLRDFMSRAG